MFRWKKWVGLFVVILLGGMAGGGVGMYFALMHDLPEIQALETLEAPAISRIYSADGVVLAEWYHERRDPVPLEEIPLAIRQAIIATEDQDFYSHSGVVPKALMRAVVHNIQAGRYKEGASTITQQLAKTLFLSPEKKLRRKMKEAVLAVQLERRYTKDEILELYLNHIYYGSGAYGVKEAARKFFAKDLDELTVGECALIAGMPKSPSRYSPLINPEKAHWRRNIVLRQMEDVGGISIEECQIEQDSPVVTRKKGVQGGKASYFTALIRQQLEDELGDNVLNKEGVTVHTSLNYSLQEYAEKALREGVQAFSEQEGMEEGALNGALVCLDVKTGEILALAGGTDFTQSPYDRATMAKRQPGSSFKPFVFTCAIEEGLSQSTLVLDEEVVFPKSQESAEWKPENYSDNFLGEISFRRALAYSRNIPAARLIYSLSPTRVVQKARSMGIKSDLKPYLSLCLGSSEVTLLEITGAYATFPNQGRWNEPHGVVEVVDRSGQVLFRPKHEKRAALDEKVAAVMVDMLESVVKEGSGKRASKLPGPVAGKTGTSSKNKDALFIGFTPEFATGVWVGRDDNQSMGKKGTGSRAALPIWTNFMEKVLEGRSVVYFPHPDGVVSVSVDPVNGRPAPLSRGVNALFIRGTEPGQGKPESWLPEKLLED